MWWGSPSAIPPVVLPESRPGAFAALDGPLRVSRLWTVSLSATVDGFFRRGGLRILHDCSVTQRTDSRAGAR